MFEEGTERSKCASFTREIARYLISPGPMEDPVGVKFSLIMFFNYFKLFQL